MALLFDKLRKPKWRHDKTEIRLEAMRELNWDDPEQRDILRQIMTGDPSREVREAAVRRILGLAGLLELADHADVLLRELVGQRLDTLGSAHPEGLKGLLVAPLDIRDDTLLFRLAAWLCRQGGLQLLIDRYRLDAPDLALRIAMQHPSSKVRLAAAESVATEQDLETLVRHSKGRDKSVYQAARTRLQGIRDAERQVRKDHEALRVLCEALELHAQTENPLHYAEKLQALARQLEGHATSIEPQLLERARQALERCQTRERSLAAERQREAEQLAKYQANSDERAATLGILQETLARLHEVPMEDQSALSTLNALATTQENRWIEAARDLRVTKPEQKEYQVAMGALRRYQGALQKFLAAGPELDELLYAEGSAEDHADRKATGSARLKRIVAEIDWPESFAPPSRLAEAVSRIGQFRQKREQEQEDERRLQKTARSLLDRLDAAVAEGAVKEARPLLKELGNILDRLSPAAATGLYQHLRLEQKRLDELRDWAGFATRPKQEDLIQRMEQLTQLHLEPHLKAERIHELQNEWKALGGTSDHTLWHRFKAAADQAYLPCKSFFDEERALKEANLVKRREITEQLRLYLDAIDWNTVDWKAADLINRQARQEWKRYFPVDFKKGKTVQEQFNEQLARLEARLQEERSRNANRKRRIIEEATLLAEAEDPRTAAQQAKALQKQWEAIGITEHREDRQLWLAFRAACDRVFESLDAQRKAHESLLEGQIGKAEEIIASLSALAADARPDPGRLRELADAFAQLTDLGKRRVALQHQFEEVVRQCRQRQRQQQQAERRDYWSGLLHAALQRRFEPVTEESAFRASARHESWLTSLSGMRGPASHDNRLTPDALVIWMEILAGLESPAHLAQQRMALQLGRLTAGAASATREAPLERLEGLLQDWAAHGDLTAEQARTDLPRVLKALETLLDRA